MSQESIIVRCSHCGTKNRVPKERMHDRAVCGKCRSTLSITKAYPDHPITVNDQNFSGEVLDFLGPVAVLFWATWCPYCQAMLPIFDQLASQYSGRIKFAKLFQDHNPHTASRFDVLSVPTLIFFQGGKETARLAGAAPRQEVERHLRMLL